MREASFSAIQMAEKLGKSRQNVYMDMKRTSMRDEQISEYAEALNVDKQVIYDRLKGRARKLCGKLLARAFANLEKQFRELKEVCTEDAQCEGLGRSIS